MTITESQIRQIVRQEVRRLAEAVPDRGPLKLIVRGVPTPAPSRGVYLVELTPSGFVHLEWFRSWPSAEAALRRAGSTVSDRRHFLVPGSQVLQQTEDSEIQSLRVGGSWG